MILLLSLQLSSATACETVNNQRFTLNVQHDARFVGIKNAFGSKPEELRAEQ